MARHGECHARREDGLVRGAGLGLARRRVRAERVGAGGVRKVACGALLCFFFLRRGFHCSISLTCGTGILTVLDWLRSHSIFVKGNIYRYSSLYNDCYM